MQSSIILLSVLILGLVVATPVDVSNFNQIQPNQVAAPRNPLIEHAILEALEGLRKDMVTGTNDIPVLDPLEVEHVHLNEELLNLPGSHVTVKDLKVNKLSTFVVDTLSVNVETLLPLRYRITFDIRVPELPAEAENYDLMLIAQGLNIFGNGDAKVKLIEPKVYGHLVLSPRVTIVSGLFYSITTSNVNFALKGFESEINGLMNDPEMSAFINQFLGHFVPDAVVVYKDDITKILSETVMEIGNELLQDFNLGGILG
uniref:SFRICE_004534 n=1 Tax=Spodoptera frugiperda TaxID=7108 RepID=A0A2H1VA62_SPOFR